MSLNLLRQPLQLAVLLGGERGCSPSPTGTEPAGSVCPLPKSALMSTSDRVGKGVKVVSAA